MSAAMMFTFNDADDRDRASDGVSRYGVYLRRYRKLFASLDNDGTVVDDPAVFAAAAWQVATSPTMAPPYLEWTAERLQSVTFTYSEHAPALIARVQVAVPRPAVLAEVYGFGEWDRGDRWNRGYHVPDDAALSRRPAMLASTLLVFHLDAGDLYSPRYAPDRLSVVDAKASVSWLAARLHGRLSPVLAALDAPGAAR